MVGRLFLFSLFMLTVSACDLDKPIKIGFIGSITGKDSAVGIAGRDGVQLAVEAANSSGGINGRMLLLVVGDDSSGPESAAKAVEGLAAEKAVAIVGPMSSVLAKAALPTSTWGKIVMVSPAPRDNVPLNNQHVTQPFVNFSQAFYRRFNYQPTPAAVLAYDAAQAVITGLHKSPSCEKFKETMMGIKAFPGLQGELVLDQYGDPDRQLYIIRYPGRGDVVE